MQDQSDTENEPGNRWSQEMAREIPIDIPFPEQPFKDPIGEQGAYESILSTFWNSPDPAMSYLDGGGFSNALPPPELDYAPSHIAEGAGGFGNYSFPVGFTYEEFQFASLPHQPMLSVDEFVIPTNPTIIPRETETVTERVGNNDLAGR
jgi:hypothetical protein